MLGIVEKTIKYVVAKEALTLGMPRNNVGSCLHFGDELAYTESEAHRKSDKPEVRYRPQKTFSIIYLASLFKEY